MSYEDQFMKDYYDYRNIGSQYYKSGYQNLLKGLNATSPTINTLVSVPASNGMSYKGSMITAKAQRHASETRNAETATSSLLDMYMRGQSLAQNSLQGAQQAYQYEDSKPSFLEEIAGFAAGGLLQGALGGSFGNIFGGKPNENTLRAPSINATPVTGVTLSGNTKQYYNTPKISMAPSQRSGLAGFGYNSYNYNPGGY